MTAQPPDNSQELPVAQVVKVRRRRWVWLIPSAAIVLALMLVIVFVVKRGTLITITMTHGHGLEPNDVLRCRGIVVGAVERVRLTNDLTTVEVVVRLDPTARQIARAGSRFWVVRPRVSFLGVAGLETIAGAKYLAVLPGHGPLQTQFIALDQPPVVELVDPGGLEIMLFAKRHRGLGPAAPILYRRVRIGTILSVGLASDAATVEVRAYIDPPYVPLVRTDSRFWLVGGVNLDLGLSGLRVEIESLESILVGGIALATPDPPGPRAGTGYRFVLHESSESEWVQWQPRIAIGAPLLPPGTPRPNMLRLTVSRTKGRFYKRTRRRKGWGLLLKGGLIAPADLLDPADDATLEVFGQRLLLTTLELKPTGALAWLPFSGPPESSAWPSERVRRMDQPEDCVVLSDIVTRPIPLAATRLQPHDPYWAVDPAVSFDPTDHGAAVVARRDGAVVGVLLVDKGIGRIVPLPADDREQ